MTQSAKTSRFTDTRQQILETAQVIILGKGFSAVGLNEILQTAQVPKGSFYHYFKSKEEFGNALLENYFDKHMIKLDNSLGNDGRPASIRLLSYFEDWKNAQCSDNTQGNCLVVKLSAEVTDLSETMRLTLKKGTENIIARLASCVKEGIDAGQFCVDEDPQTVTANIYYLWIGATLLTKVHRNPMALDSAMRSLKIKLNLDPDSST